ncbi:hypothetical protein GCM10010441_38820 [Kitasatospora paracochleata]|uniref:Lipoprotein n=1 Tax=Kitasatospora paracochleata TaxID=58354 RepID=A0ABT1IPB6_9ACTN|nr:hypothetical protein [Kitasatospora paracochleata]MCP2306964.1 hypothetical protein [Kitasatospora paracochleata]
MRIRPAVAAALLAVTALGLTACDPDSSGGAAQSPAASAAASSASSAAAPANSKAPAPKQSSTSTVGDAPATDGAKPDCKTYYASHKVVHAKTVDKALTKMTVLPVKANCNDNGVFFNDVEGSTVSYPVAADVKTTLFMDQGVQLKAVSGGMTHVKTCAETPHLTDTDKLPAGYFCYQDYYEITLDSHGTITALTETYSS